MGRPQKPTVIKKRQGTARNHRLNPDEPQLEPLTACAPPTWLEKDVVEVWERLIPEVIAMGHVAAKDVESLAMACVAVAEAYCDPTPMRLNAARGWLGDLGLTPTSTARVKALSGMKQTPLEKLLGGAA